MHLGSVKPLHIVNKAHKKFNSGSDHMYSKWHYPLRKPALTSRLDFAYRSENVHIGERLYKSVHTWFSA